MALGSVQHQDGRTTKRKGKPAMAIEILEVHHTGIRAKLQSLFGLVLLGDAAWAAYIVWSI